MHLNLFIVNLELKLLQPKDFYVIGSSILLRELMHERISRNEGD